MKYIIVAMLFFCDCTYSSAQSQDGMKWYESITGITYSSSSFYSFPIFDLKLHADKSSTVLFYSKNIIAHTFSKNNLYNSYPSRPYQFISLCQFSPEGTLRWTARIDNGLGLGAYKPFSFFEIDSKGNTIAIVRFRDFVIVGADTLRLTSYNSYGIAAFIFSPTGTILSKRILCEGYDLDLEAMTVDQSDNIYIAGKFYKYNIVWEGSEIKSQESPSYFLASYTTELQKNWVRALSTGWDTYGQIANVVYNPLYNCLHILITMGTYGTSSSCKYQSWVLNHQSWSMTGKQLTSDTLALCDDLMVGGDCAVDRYGNLMVVGRFRGTLQSGSFQVTTPSAEGECNITNSFVLKRDNSGKTLTLTPLIHNTTHSLHSIKTMPNGDYYLAGRINYLRPSATWFGDPYPKGTRRSYIGRYDYWGNLLSYREFSKNAPSSDQDYWDYLHVDVHSDGDVIVADNHSGKYDTLAMSPSPDDRNCSMSLFLLSGDQLNSTDYIHADGWIFSNLSTQNDAITINAQLSDYQSYRYEVYDILGKVVLQGMIDNGNPIEKLSISSLASGTYYLRVSNPLRSQTTYFIVTR